VFVNENRYEIKAPKHQATKLQRSVKQSKHQPSAALPGQRTLQFSFASLKFSLELGCLVFWCLHLFPAQSLLNIDFGVGGGEQEGRLRRHRREHEWTFGISIAITIPKYVPGAALVSGRKQ